MIQPGSLALWLVLPQWEESLGSPLLLLPPTMPAGLHMLTHLSCLKRRFKLGPLICKRLTTARRPAALDIHGGSLGSAQPAAAVGLRESWGSVASGQKPLDTWPPSLRSGNSRVPGSRVVWPTCILLQALRDPGWGLSLGMERGGICSGKDGPDGPEAHDLQCWSCCSWAPSLAPCSCAVSSAGST